LTVPPYASPLNSTTDPAGWWQAAAASADSGSRPHRSQATVRGCTGRSDLPGISADGDQAKRDPQNPLRNDSCHAGSKLCSSLRKRGQRNHSPGYPPSPFSRPFNRQRRRKSKDAGPTIRFVQRSCLQNWLSPVLSSQPPKRVPFGCIIGAVIVFPDSLSMPIPQGLVTSTSETGPPS
jgi:hypothetical protein